MALLFMDAFGNASAGSHSDTTAGDDLRINWLQFTSATITELATGSSGRRAYMTGNAGVSLVPDITLDTTTIVVGFRYWRGSASDQLILRFGDLNANLGWLLLTPSGQLVYNNSNTPTSSSNIVAWSSEFVPKNEWCYIEVKVVFNGSTGTVDFRINGIAAGSFTGLDTIASGTTCRTISIADNTSYSDWNNSARITDIYIDDASFHGPVQVWYQAADTAGSNAGFTPSAGSNHQNVDEIGNDGDTTYNASTATSTKDGLTTSKTAPADPIALQPLVIARYVSPGSAFLQVGVLSDPGGTPTEDLKAKEGLGDTYSGRRGKIYETDPDTASGWTAANANAAEIVYTHVA